MNYDFGTDNLMVTAAHRYCLGRMTYAVKDCVDWLIRIWDFIDENTKDIIIKETKQAIEKGKAGMQCDVDEWKRLLSAVCTTELIQEAQNMGLYD